MVTTTTSATKGFSREAVEELSHRRNEPDWLREKRIAAWETYEQIPIPEDQLKDSLKWVVDNQEVDVLYVDEQPSDVQVASAVEMEVTETEPGLKGDTVSGGGDKPATLESGVIVRVPLFVNVGDRVRVDTRSGDYVSRA